MAGLAQRPLFLVLALLMAVAAALVQAHFLYPAALAVLAVVETVVMRQMARVLMEQQIPAVAVVVALALAQ